MILQIRLFSQSTGYSKFKYSVSYKLNYEVLNFYLSLFYHKAGETVKFNKLRRLEAKRGIQVK